jgi:hypothetical protein
MWIGKVLAATAVGILVGQSQVREAEKEAPPAKSAGRSAEKPDGSVKIAVAPLATRDVTERLKSIRSEIVVEQELITLRKAQLARMELEAQIGHVSNRGKTPDKPVAPSIIQVIAPKKELEKEIEVKSITLKPYKEAIVVHYGKVYVVRPGDKLGTVEIRDINDGGVIINEREGGGARSVMVNQ